MSSTSDLTTEARIRNAALDLFGRLGSEAVSVRAIAEHAGVSAALVMHHFGSKAGLIDAVDDHLIERVAHYLEDFAATTDTEEATSVIVAMVREPVVFNYMARALTEEGAAGAKLFDRLHRLSVETVDALIDAGLCRAVDDREGLATLLIVADLGMMVMRHHVARVLGVDPYGPDGMARLVALDVEIKTNPLITFPNRDQP